MGIANMSMSATPNHPHQLPSALLSPMNPHHLPRHARIKSFTSTDRLALTNSYLAIMFHPTTRSIDAAIKTLDPDHCPRGFVSTLTYAVPSSQHHPPLPLPILRPLEIHRRYLLKRLDLLLRRSVGKITGIKRESESLGYVLVWIYVVVM